MSNRKRFLLLLSIGVLVLTGLTFTFNSKIPAAYAFTQQCPPAQSQGGSNTTEWVMAIQARLNSLWFNEVDANPPNWWPAGVPELAIDGSFGPDTKAVVHNYQLDVMGVTNGGDVVGDRTWGSLGFCPAFPAQVPAGYNHAGNTCPAVTLSSSGSNDPLWVKALQDLLNMDGYEAAIPRSYNGDNWWPMGVDGSFGTHTKNAVEAFQHANFLTPEDGVVGTHTWQAMGMCGA
jgi:peptidoglycan hydrolase-like protein with peptidoglycan-binding domain